MSARPYLRGVSLRREDVPSHDSYPFSIPAVRELRDLEFHPDVTFIIGENGCGKSTLLEAIAAAWGFNPEGGTVNFRFSTRASHSELHTHLRLVKSTRRPKDGFFLRAESFFNVATDIERIDAEPTLGSPVINSYGGRSLHEQSHGESFLALMLHRFGGNGLYILDEPEAALSPARQLAVLRRIHQLVQDDSQFIIATHSPILMAYPGARILLLDATGFNEVRYEDTEHYAVTREFLENPGLMLERLLADDEEDARELPAAALEVGSSRIQSARLRCGLESGFVCGSPRPRRKPRRRSRRDWWSRERENPPASGRPGLRLGGSSPGGSRPQRRSPRGRLAPRLPRSSPAVLQRPRLAQFRRPPVRGSARGPPSAYGFILNRDGRLAVVRSSEGTFLPGGGIEEGETPEEAVVRETFEECSLVIRVGECVSRAVQLVVVEDVLLEKRSLFFEARIESEPSTRVEHGHETMWVAPATADRLLLHEIQSWAVRDRATG